MIELPKTLIADLRRAKNVAVLTGAGISAESGLPTFRDALTGLWSSFNPYDLATPEGFERNPKLVWDWYALRRKMAREAQPNPGHRALVSLAKFAALTIITQNVDGLHQVAGSENVIELHGNIYRVKCFNCDRLAKEWDENSPSVPKCVHCNGYLRPDVVWFGEMLPTHAYFDAVHAAQTCDVFLSIGTSGVVEPAASLPDIASRHAATIVYINLDHPSSNRAPIYHIYGKAGEVLPALMQMTYG
jgi:NAD-dependent deacetylase